MAPRKPESVGVQLSRFTSCSSHGECLGRMMATAPITARCRPNVSDFDGSGFLRYSDLHISAFANTHPRIFIPFCRPCRYGRVEILKRTAPLKPNVETTRHAEHSRSRNPIVRSRLSPGNPARGGPVGAGAFAAAAHVRAQGAGDRISSDGEPPQRL